MTKVDLTYKLLEDYVCGSVSADEISESIQEDLLDNETLSDILECCEALEEGRLSPIESYLLIEAFKDGMISEDCFYTLVEHNMIDLNASITLAEAVSLLDEGIVDGIKKHAGKLALGAAILAGAQGIGGHMMDKADNQIAQHKSSLESLNKQQGMHQDILQKLDAQKAALTGNSVKNITNKVIGNTPGLKQVVKGTLEGGKTLAHLVGKTGLPTEKAEGMLGQAQKYIDNAKDPKAAMGEITKKQVDHQKALNSISAEKNEHNAEIDRLKSIKNKAKMFTPTTYLKKLV